MYFCQSAMVKRKKDGEDEGVVPFKNKQRVLVFATRGLTQRYRHLLKDIRLLLPHHHKDSKMEGKDKLHVVNEICEMKSCNKCIFFEMRKAQDLFMWFSASPYGPSVKFHTSNVHTMAEMRLIGNCLLGARPILNFESTFDSQPHWQLIKELFIQIWGTPKGHKKSKPFIDHVFSFYIQEDRIWFRHYQIVQKDTDKNETETSLVEIGPRFVLNPIRIFEYSFSGATLWENPHFVSPNMARRLKKVHGAQKVIQRGKNYQKTKERKEQSDIVDELDGIFEQ